MSLFQVVVPEKIPQALAEALSGFTELAHEHQTSLYLVGGAIRDLLLGRTPREFDLAVSGDLKSWLHAVHSQWSRLFPLSPPIKKPVYFKKYLTGKILCEGDFAPGFSSVDFSQLRSERYEFSGAYPAVLPGDIRSDQFRRDFTLNAMAFELLADRGTGEKPEGRIAMIDTFQGKEDLERGVLRVLHDRSFEDDPVRLVRAARFIARFQFALESETESLFSDAVSGDYLSRVPRRRLFDEVKKALQESDIERVLTVFADKGILGQLFPGVGAEYRFENFRAIDIDGRLAEIYRPFGLTLFAEALRSFECSRAEVERYLAIFEGLEGSTEGETNAQ